MYLSSLRRRDVVMMLPIKLSERSNVSYFNQSCQHFRNSAVSRSSRKLSKPKAGVIRPKVTIPGQATKQGTEKFIMDSGIQLFHKFHISNLYVNPIIHGPPRLNPVRDRRATDLINYRLADKQLLTAVHRNWSNMIYVYNHYSDSHEIGYWNATVLPHIMLRKTIKDASNPHYRPRESLVTVAGLGLVTDYQQILKRLEQARETTGLEKIDFAIVECNDRTFNQKDDKLNDQLPDVIRGLEQLCKDGILQSYGVQISIKPYNYHNPPLKRSGGLMMVPSLFESSIIDGELVYADLVIYPISPTHATPHTYPMLDPDPDNHQVDPGDEEPSHEDSRKFTRAALDPFLCFCGGDMSEIADEMTMERAAKYGAEDRGATGSEEPSKVYLDPLDDPEVISAIKRGHDLDRKYEQEKERIREEFPDLDDESVKMMASDAVDLSTRLQDIQETKGVAAKDDVGVELKRLKEMSRIPDLILLSGINKPEVERFFAKDLDDHCVLLETTPRLQDKALRCVLSIGCEVVIVDAELSALLPKLTLSPIDLLTADETEHVFGEFGIQKGGGDSDDDDDDDE